MPSVRWELVTNANFNKSPSFFYLHKCVSVCANSVYAWHTEHHVRYSNTSEGHQEVRWHKEVKMATLTVNIYFSWSIFCTINDELQFLFPFLLIFAMVEHHGHSAIRLCLRVGYKLKSFVNYLASSSLPFFTSQWGVSCRSRIRIAPGRVRNEPKIILHVLQDKKALVV